MAIRQMYFVDTFFLSLKVIFDHFPQQSTAAKSITNRTKGEFVAFELEIKLQEPLQ